MKRKQVIVSLFLASILSLSAFAGCAPKQATPPAAETKQETPAAEGEKAAEPAPAAEGEKAAEPAPADTQANSELEPYSYVHYYNYDYWTIKEWAADEASKFMANKFNVQIEFQKPDADPQAKLNLMISSGDLPDSIMMDRGTDNINLARLGMLTDLAPLQANNKNYDDNILPQTQELLKIDGKLYGVPNWARKGPTGGNEAWLYNKRIYEAAGSPDLSTFEGLYAYAKKVKDTVPNTKEGVSVTPFMVGYDAADVPIARAFYRSMGGVNKANVWYGRVDGKLQLILRDDLYKKAIMEANKWYREGLISQTQFSDTTEQIVEKFVAGRAGLMYYDFSQESINHFRSILMKSFPDDSYELVKNPVYPPANGISPDKIYGDEKPTVGWNVTCITTKATNPQRIFDVLSYMLTKEGSINMMYGPKGQLWDELDANGNPILKTPEALIPVEEKTRLGLWQWAEPGHADNVDLTKFAVNDMQPEDKREWVVSNQAHVITPICFVTDEYVNLANTVEPGTDEQIKRTLCEDQIKADIPKIMMAASEEEASKMYDELLAFCDKNGIATVEAKYDAKYQENIKLQGKTLYER